ncbi:ABC transporter permease [Streptomyces sp. NPDC057249]|uniref:ABC transporter permease n=1 Tax=Streptomyces sp. NPDC057249 TaxID=3346067 RepID=UPI00363559F0
MRRHWSLFVTASRYALIGHARNRFAMLLVVVYIPVWIGLAYVAIPSRAAPFRLRATGEILAPPGNHLTQITGALNAVTLIAGFMMFAATFTGGAFDRRLAMAGYPRYHLVLAKLTALTLVCTAVAAYATVAAGFAWAPRQPFVLAAGLFLAALTYGALGVVFGSVLRREVEGMFAILMISILDVALQNPLSSSGSDSPVVRFLPTYGSVQASMSAAFSDAPAGEGLAIQLLWLTGAACAGLLVFRRRTRDALSQRGTARVPAPARSRKAADVRPARTRQP